MFRLLKRGRDMWRQFWYFVFDIFVLTIFLLLFLTRKITWQTWVKLHCLISFRCPILIHDNIFMHACMYACVHVCLHSCMFECVHVHACVHACVCMHGRWHSCSVCSGCVLVGFVVGGNDSCVFAHNLSWIKIGHLKLMRQCNLTHVCHVIFRVKNKNKNIVKTKISKLSSHISSSLRRRNIWDKYDIR